MEKRINKEAFKTAELAASLESKSGKADFGAMIYYGVGTV